MGGNETANFDFFSTKKFQLLKSTKASVFELYGLI